MAAWAQGADRRGLVRMGCCIILPVGRTSPMRCVNGLVRMGSCCVILTLRAVGAASMRASMSSGLLARHDG